MRIIIEVDNATPLTLQTTPSSEGQTSPATPQAATSPAAAIDAGAAPTDDTDQSGVEEFADHSEDTSAEEASAGEAPDL